MAANPLVQMLAAGVACSAALLFVSQKSHGGAILLGLLAPLLAAAATWSIVERTHAAAPERVSKVMLKLFGAKLVLLGVYVASIAVLLGAAARWFVVSFACHYILLHVMEAVHLQRLFSGEMPRWRVR